MCTPNDGKWEVAVTTLQLTPLGKVILGSEEVVSTETFGGTYDLLTSCQKDIQQMHRDHVPTLPPNCYLLGSTTVCFNQGFIVFDQSSPPSIESIESGSPPVPLSSIHIFTVQGHPEFTPGIMHAILDARSHIFKEVITADGRKRADGIPGKQHVDGRACDGVRIIGKAIWGILGVA